MNSNIQNCYAQLPQISLGTSWPTINRFWETVSQGPLGANPDLLYPSVTRLPMGWCYGCMLHGKGWREGSLWCFSLAELCLICQHPEKQMIHHFFSTVCQDHNSELHLVKIYKFSSNSKHLSISMHLESTEYGIHATQKINICSSKWFAVASTTTLAVQYSAVLQLNKLPGTCLVERMFV